MKKKLTSILMLTSIIAGAIGPSWASITPFSSFSNSQQSTTLTALQNTDVMIAGSNLQNSKDYLILYSAAYGADNSTNVPEVVVSYGGTVIARGADEGSSSGSPEAMRIASLHGFYVLTGDGSSDLRIRWRTTTGGTAYIKGKSLIAVPLDSLIENDDYWFVQQNGDAAEVSTTSSFTDLLTTTLDLPENGDYLVFMSAEGWTPAGTSTNGEQFRAVINTATQKAAMAKEWEGQHSQSFLLLC